MQMHQRDTNTLDNNHLASDSSCKMLCIMTVCCKQILGHCQAPVKPIRHDFQHLLIVTHHGMEAKVKLSV